jgi:chlorite dismutase
MTHQEFENLRERRTTEELISQFEKWFKRLHENSESYTMNVPPRINDTDIVFADVVKRLNQLQKENEKLRKENEELKILLRQSTSVYKTDSENDLKWEEKRNKILKIKTE